MRRVVERVRDPPDCCADPACIQPGGTKGKFTPPADRVKRVKWRVALMEAPFDASVWFLRRAMKTFVAFDVGDLATCLHGLSAVEKRHLILSLILKAPGLVFFICIAGAP